MAVSERALQHRFLRPERVEIRRYFERCADVKDGGCGEWGEKRGHDVALCMKCEQRRAEIAERKQTETKRRTEALQRRFANRRMSGHESAVS